MKIDCHFHIVGDGSSGSGCFINLNNTLRKAKAYGLLSLAKLPLSSLGKSLDSEYKDHALQLIKNSELDKAVILAQDHVYNDDGSINPSQTLFFTPDEYVLKLAEEYQEFIPALSIHPYRKDAIEALERGHEKGARILKYLPSVLNIDFSKKSVRPFIEKARDLDMIFLVHTGGELSLPVIRPEFHDPKCLYPLLNQGIKVIAAHGGSASHPLDPDYKGTIAEMLKEFPHLYIDNSGCNTPFRSKHLPAFTKEPFASRVLYGSDYPIPVSSLWLRLRNELTPLEHKNCKKEINTINRDILIKEYLGFPSESLTRLASTMNTLR